MLLIQEVPRGGISGQWYNKWFAFVCEALGCFDKDNNRWLYLPNTGGYYDQDEFTMTIWEAVRASYIRALKKPKIVSYVQNMRKKDNEKFNEELASINKGKK